MGKEGAMQRSMSVLAHALSQAMSMSDSKGAEQNQPGPTGNLL
jgi:hypothetical protein